MQWFEYKPEILHYGRKKKKLSRTVIMLRFEYTVLYNLLMKVYGTYQNYDECRKLCETTIVQHMTQRYSLPVCAITLICIKVFLHFQS